MTTPVISIITPCYNHGIYLNDAIQSIKAINTPYAYEHIIVNDGSTDSYTIAKLKSLQAEGHYIINQLNQGLAAARNNGIAASQGKYIIPLDSDNKLHSNYMVTAIETLEKNNSINIVYGNGQWFGNGNGVLKPGNFDIGKIMRCNYIDACAVIRKTLFEKTGGYDSAMPGMGNEDWELWVNAFTQDALFYYLDDICYYYRVTDTSMRLSETKNNFEANSRYILNKHGFNIIQKISRGYYNWNYVSSHKLKAGIQLITGRL